jgi:hypothetical protein
MQISFVLAKNTIVSFYKDPQERKQRDEARIGRSVCDNVSRPFRQWRTVTVANNHTFFLYNLQKRRPISWLYVPAWLG